ncbi:Hypothetical protein FKW44_019063 [Caligus rogercresseyi]|uniref:CRESS-DNA virus Rep endonuclease domain-containing protein n=1 Tax=Caligus rogercresseyi TaxID=217165 RepID=A0A7T8JX95_CALRO|nr:Hypothetical protein FKW44_019063 [Caligus rogercresseyi]
MVRSNKICFTLNNFYNEEQSGLLDYLNLNERWIKFAIIGEETDQRGRYIYKVTAINGNLKFWKKLPGLQRAHIEDARGDDQPNLDYCSKGMFRRSRYKRRYARTGKRSSYRRRILGVLIARSKDFTKT